MKRRSTIKDLLSTETPNPATHDLDHMSTQQMVQAIHQEDTRVITAVKETLPEIARAIDAIAERMRHGGRLIYLGAGTSGRLGVLDASECPPTFNVPPGLVIGLIAGGERALRSAVEGAEDSMEDAVKDLRDLVLIGSDSLVGISASGSTPYVLAGLRYACTLGALTIGVACNRLAALSEVAEISILADTGPEVVSGSTRMKAGSAQKMILNMLSTGVMVRLGKTYGNLMVDVQPTNNKLRQRAVRLVKQTCNLDDRQAETLLEGCDWQVKTAIAAFHLKCTAQEARTALQTASGMLRQVIEQGKRQP